MGHSRSHSAVFTVPWNRETPTMTAVSIGSDFFSMMALKAMKLHHAVNNNTWNRSVLDFVGQDLFPARLRTTKPGKGRFSTI
jgi:hypothetical protein